MLVVKTKKGGRAGLTPLSHKKIFYPSSGKNPGCATDDLRKTVYVPCQFSGVRPNLRGDFLRKPAKNAELINNFYWFSQFLSAKHIPYKVRRYSFFQSFLKVVIFPTFFIHPQCLLRRADKDL